MKKVKGRKRMSMCGKRGENERLLASFALQINFLRCLHLIDCATNNAVR